ncbi:unnamed protein product [Gulo gulo]|uniref:Uncharacterized protein n=1 Tax=Gulo gulo TaxID=48420 RepID=A0A9X9LZR1_GULGU|nr:unnamed protein product [Gulo gulo]
MTLLGFAQVDTLVHIVK